MDWTSLAPFQEPIKIVDKTYIIVEADGPAGDDFRAASLRGVEMVFDDDAGTRTVRKLEGISSVEALLISKCLYFADDTGRLRLDAEGNPDKQFLVPAKIVQAWPNRLRKSLFEKIKEVSDLGERDDLDSLIKQRNRLNAKIERIQSGKSQSATKDTSA